MARETVAEKARRYLAEGRLTLLGVDARHIHATCRGDGQVYQLNWSRESGWTCDCEARTTCAHLTALRLVTMRESAD